MDIKKISKMIDHTLLKQDATEQQIKQLCKEAKENDFCSVCINPSYVPLCSAELQNSSVKVCTVIGFPLGATTTGTKVFEANEAIKNGANEVDMVINVGKLKSAEWDYIAEDITEVMNVARNRAVLKVIIETCLLTEEEKIKVCQICKDIGVDFVKTSTGFSTGGAIASDVELMRETVGPEMGVKASGNVRSLEDATNMINAGASRLGTSSGLAIINGNKSTSEY
ncbi:MAG: deoxyribose-phosphate aldolase [Candidatus Epulonipiscioides saccharophilum]|nr:MAG: deoxyribose-phosphate aldolase [Epulopiscium sp. AS2M-Bin001]